MHAMQPHKRSSGGGPSQISPTGSLPGSFAQGQLVRIAPKCNLQINTLISKARRRAMALSKVPFKGSLFFPP
eukprot:359853-Chlamydomonas_euryale.AAC.19